MADIATLGLEVRSDQVEKGANSLDRLTRAAARAEAAAMGVATGSRQAASGSASVASSSANAAGALDREAAAARRAQQALNVHSRAVNDNVRRMGGSMSGLAAQVQDIGVTAAMGMNPMLIALQQGTQIAGQMEVALQGGASASSVFGQALRSLISPVSLISIGLTAILAAGLQMVDWAGVASAALSGLASVLETIAPYAAMAAAGLALIYAPAIIGGLVSLIAMLSQVGIAAVTAAAAMATANPAAAFVLGITAAVAAATIFRDELTQIFGVDLVGAAKTGANLVIGSFVAAYEDLKFVWSNFPAIIGSAAIGAANAVISGMNAMIAKATELLNGFVAKINGVLAALPFGAGEGIAIPEIGGFSIGGIENGFADQLSAAVGQRNAAVQGALSRDYLGEFGTAIANGASAASGKLKELAGSLGAAEKAKKGAKSEAEKLAEKYNDILLGAEGFISSQMAERDALFLTEQAASALRHEQDLLNKAMQAGITIDAAKAAELKSYAAAMAEAEAETSSLKKALDFGKDLVGGFVSDLRSGLEQGKGFWRSFGDAAMNVLDKIVDKLLNNVIDALFQVNSTAAGVGGGGLFGFLGGLFGLGGGFPAAPAGGGPGLLSGGVSGLWANGGAFHRGNVIPFAKGGVVTRPTLFPMANGAGLMGEAGPEAIMPLRRGPDGRLGVAAANTNAANQNVRVEVEVFVNDDGTIGAIASTAGRNAAVSVVQANNKARQKLYQNGGEPR